ncbi:MAG: response regulator, partial [Chthoniobacteraceae bacterium]
CRLLLSGKPMHTSLAPQTAESSELDIKSILVLDDDIELADTLKALLESHNFVVTTVTNGVEGLREVMDLDFDVIICDLVMPSLPGDMFYLAVKKIKPHLCHRFLFITGHSDNPRVDAFLKQTNGLVLIKPVLTEELVPMIAEILNRTAAAA